MSGSKVEEVGPGPDGALSFQKYLNRVYLRCSGSSLSRIIELGISTPFDCSSYRSNRLIAVVEEAQGCWMLTLLPVFELALTLGHGLREAA